MDDVFDNPNGMDWAKNSGVKEGKLAEKIEIVKNMLNENIVIDIISKLTGLMIEEIEEIKNKNI